MKKNISIILVLIGIFFSVNYVFAQGADDTPGVVGTPAKQGVVGTPKPATPIVKLDNPIKANNVKVLLGQIVNLAIYLGAILAVFVFMWIGFKFVMAQGNPKEIEAAKEWLKWAVVGTALLLGSKVVLEIIKTTFIESGLVDKNLF